MKLPLDRFNPAVRDSVLVALDLLIVNAKAEVLVGRRKQSPGGDWLFALGVRVYKGRVVDQGAAATVGE